MGQALVGLEPVGALIQRLGEPGAVELDPQASTCLLWAVARLGKVPWLSDLANHMARPGTTALSRSVRTWQKREVMSD